MINDIIFILAYNPLTKFAQIAQLVEQRTENPCVGGSIPPLGTILQLKSINSIHLFIYDRCF